MHTCIQEYKKALTCKLCDAKFGYIYPRKQQCGECSNAFCNTCSNQKISKVRHCKSCYNIKIEGNEHRRRRRRSSKQELVVPKVARHRVDDNFSRLRNSSLIY